LDYLAVGQVDPETVATVVGGVAEGCRQAGCALLGGETAEHPGAMAPGDLDLAGFAVGVVGQEEMLGPSRVAPGDLLVGIGSPGLRSNGYTLARHVLLERAGRHLEDPAWAGADHSLADELLVPSVIYTPGVLRAIRAGGGGVHACAHITGGGIPGNLVRVLPGGMRAEVDQGTWEVPAIFSEIARLGPVAPEEMARVFNLGLGMILVVAPEAAGVVVEALGGAGHQAAVVGRVSPGDKEVVLQ
jgi:phosphoribosylformylglycinamidine cyclo-ligase